MAQTANDQLINDITAIIKEVGFTDCDCTIDRPSRNLRLQISHPEIKDRIGFEISHYVLPVPVEQPSYDHKILAAQMMKNPRLNEDYRQYKSDLFKLMNRVVPELLNYVESFRFWFIALYHDDNTMKLELFSEFKDSGKFNRPDNMIYWWTISGNNKSKAEYALHVAQRALSDAHLDYWYKVPYFVGREIPLDYQQNLIVKTISDAVKEFTL